MQTGLNRASSSHIASTLASSRLTLNYTQYLDAFSQNKKKVGICGYFIGATLARVLSDRNIFSSAVIHGMRPLFSSLQLVGIEFNVATFIPLSLVLEECDF